jgi:hypothetical protein
MHPDFFVRNYRKNTDESILILVIYWEKKTGLLRKKIRNHNIFIIETQKIIVTATKIIFTVVFTQCISNRCMGIYKFGNKYLPSAYKTRFEFRSHFSGKKSASYRSRNTVIVNKVFLLVVLSSHCGPAPPAS